MSFRQKSRERVHPKMGKLDIDYQAMVRWSSRDLEPQVLHDAFFKFMKKPKMSKLGSFLCHMAAGHTIPV